jgi:uncharacterized OB-fold protein
MNTRNREADTTPMRQLPALEMGSRFFWESGADGVLRILRCTCGRFQHPPLPRCPVCGSTNLEPARVSGRGKVATFTLNYQPWRPGLTLPYVFAAVELEEQSELYVFTNIIDCPPEAVQIGMSVEVVFEHHADVYLPLFHPRVTNGGSGQ